MSLWDYGFLSGAGMYLVSLSASFILNSGTMGFYLVLGFIVVGPVLYSKAKTYITFLSFSHAYGSLHAALHGDGEGVLCIILWLMRLMHHWVLLEAQATETNTILGHV